MLANLFIATISLAAQPPADVQGVSVKHSAAETRVGPDTIYPDAERNPGATNPDVTKANIADNICNKNWKTTSIRPPASYTTKLKIQQLVEYGNTVHQTKAQLGGADFNEAKCKLHSDNTRCYEEDHIVSLQNGGAPSDPQNLFPEAYNTTVKKDHVGAHEKDKVENFIHNAICLDLPNAKLQAGPKPKKSLTLEEGQRVLAIDWYACYQSMAAKKDCVPPK